mgnify:CR=1 FL=1|jgi:hypothetical protein
MEKEEKEKILWDCIENRAGERAKDFFISDRYF